MSSDRTVDRACTTCRGVIRLEERAAMLAASDGSGARVRRTLAEAQWFLLVLPKVKRCAAHDEGTESVRRLAERLLQQSNGGRKA